MLRVAARKVAKLSAAQQNTFVIVYGRNYYEYVEDAGACWEVGQTSTLLGVRQVRNLPYSTITIIYIYVSHSKHIHQNKRSSQIGCFHSLQHPYKKYRKETINTLFTIEVMLTIITIVDFMQGIQGTGTLTYISLKY